MPPKSHLCHRTVCWRRSSRGHGHWLTLGQSEALRIAPAFEMPTIPTAGAVFRVQPGESEVLSRPWTVYVTDPHSGLSVDLAGAKFGPSCFRPLCDLGVQGD